MANPHSISSDSTIPRQTHTEAMIFLQLALVIKREEKNKRIWDLREKRHKGVEKGDKAFLESLYYTKERVTKGLYPIPGPGSENRVAARRGRGWKMLQGEALQALLEADPPVQHVNDDPSDDEDEDEGEERECEECGDWYPRDELDEDGYCYSCAESAEIMGQVRRVAGLLPRNMTVKEVRGNHSKGCDSCGKSDWSMGEWYVYDAANPWGGDKYCLDCAEVEYAGNDSSDEDEGEDEGEEGEEEEDDDQDHSGNDQHKAEEIGTKRSAEDVGASAEEHPAQRQRVA